MIISRPKRWACALALACAAAVLGACGGGAGHDAGSPAPTDSFSLLAIGGSSTAVSLSWASVDGADSYTVERQAADGSYQTLADLPGGTRTYVDGALQSATTYRYRIRARRSGDIASAEGAATTTSDQPVQTAQGGAIGEPVQAGIGPLGGSLDGSLGGSSGSVHIEVPAGAWTADATVAVQAIDNTAPGAVAGAVQLTLPAVPAQPLSLALNYGDDVAAIVDGVGVALQLADGSWLSLPLRLVDRAARRLQVDLPVGVLTPPPAAAVASGTSRRDAAPSTVHVVIAPFTALAISPQTALVQTGASQTLAVSSRTFTGPLPADCAAQLCAPLPVLAPRALAPLTDASLVQQWLVEDVAGGNAALGTVRPDAGNAATYVAPATLPAPNPVGVTWRLTDPRTGRALSLRAAVTVVAPPSGISAWQGAVSGALAGSADLGFTMSADVRWHADPSASGTFLASGTQSVQVVEIDCTASASPSTVDLPPGVLTIDRSTIPATYTLDVGSLWNTVITGQCPGRPTTSVGMVVPGRLQATGPLSADGRRIDGSARIGNVDWSWSFTAQP